METWQQLMREGNQLYDLKKWHQALSHYHQAIVLLENSLTIESPETHQAVQGWICGYHNVATIYEQQGFIERCRDTLIIPFRTMIALANNPQASSEMQSIARHTLQITLRPLLEFTNKYPTELQFINNIIQQLNTYDQLGNNLH